MALSLGPLSPPISYLSLSTGLVLEEEPCLFKPCQASHQSLACKSEACFWPPIRLTVFTTIGNCPAAWEGVGAVLAPSFCLALPLGFGLTGSGRIIVVCRGLKEMSRKRPTERTGTSRAQPWGGQCCYTGQGLALPAWDYSHQ